MMEAIFAAGAGLAAGVVHVLSGPDHLAAVLPFAVQSPARAWRLGISWGFGHGLGVLLLGLVFFVLREVAPVEQISRSSELLVGGLLVALGAWTIRRSRLAIVHAHEHQHAADGHSHPHIHIADPSVGRSDHLVSGRHDAHHHSTLGFGVIHGLAGVGHLLAASPLLAFSKAAGGAYLISYLASGALVMSVFAHGSSRLARDPRRLPWMLRCAGVTSVLVGLFWVSSFALA